MGDKRKIKPQVGWNERDVMIALAKRYPDPEWAFFPQARSGTGYISSLRTADAIAMNLWPSRGLEMHGFEVKVNRSDFLNELRNPEKADSIARYCDRWWLVIAGGYGDEEANIVHPGELPPTWGLLVMHGNVLRCDVEAPKLEALPLDRHFVASLLRNQAQCPNKELQERYEEGLARGKEMAGRESRTLRENVEKFEAASGIKITDSWSIGNMGKAVKVLMGMRYDVVHIRDSAARAQTIADVLRSMIDDSGLGPLADEMEE